MITRQQIVDAAREWLNTPFVHQGRTKGVACDCAGLGQGVAASLGIPVSDYLNYGKSPNPALMGAILLRNLETINVDDAMPGDIYWMRFAKDPQHIAIKTDMGIIHSYMQVGRVVEHRLDTKWKRRIVKAFRYPGVN